MRSVPAARFGRSPNPREKHSGESGCCWQGVRRWKISDCMYQAPGKMGKILQACVTAIMRARKQLGAEVWDPSSLPATTPAMPTFCTCVRGGVLWPMASSAVNSKMNCFREISHHLSHAALPYPTGPLATLPLPGGRGAAAHGHWSGAGAAGKPQLPPSAGADRANPGWARLGWDHSLFLEALETSRDGAAFFSLPFTDGVILICYVFVHGVFIVVIVYCVLPFIHGIKEAELKRSGRGEALDSPGGAEAARLPAEWGHECLCHEMSVLPILPVALARPRDAEGRRGASRFPPGPQPGSRLPAGDAVETVAFQETRLKAEHSK